MRHVPNSSVADPPTSAGGDEGTDGDGRSVDGTGDASIASEPRPLRDVLRRGAALSLLVAVVLTLVLEVSTLWGGDPQWIVDQFVTGVGFYLCCRRS
jgi:hypothetical protein